MSCQYFSFINMFKIIFCPLFAIVLIVGLWDVLSCTNKLPILFHFPVLCLVVCFSYWYIIGMSYNLLPSFLVTSYILVLNSRRFCFLSPPKVCLKIYLCLLPVIHVITLPVNCHYTWLHNFISPGCGKNSQMLHPLIIVAISRTRRLKVLFSWTMELIWALLSMFLVSSVFLVQILNICLSFQILPIRLHFMVRLIG